MDRFRVVLALGAGSGFRCPWSWSTVLGRHHHTRGWLAGYWSSRCGGSRRVLGEPVEHRLRAPLELHVAVPSGCGALDPLQLLVGHRNVVEHRLDVARVGEGVAANLVEERWHADVFGPLLRGALLEPDAGAQAEKRVEVVEAVAEAEDCEPAFGDVSGGDRLW